MLLAGKGVQRGLRDGRGSGALLNRPHSVLPLPDGSILVSDEGNNALRLLTSGGGVRGVSRSYPG